MTELEQLVAPLVLQHLTPEEQDYLTEIFRRYDGYPSLEQMWSLLDQRWIAHGCNPVCRRWDWSRASGCNMDWRIGGSVTWMYWRRVRSLTVGASCIHGSSGYRWAVRGSEGY